MCQFRLFVRTHSPRVDLACPSTVNNVQELIAHSKEVHSEWCDMKINIKAMQDAFRHTQRAAPGATVGG